MFLIKAHAEVRGGRKGQAGAQQRVNALTGVSRGTNPMTAYYRRGGVTNLGGNSRTRNRGRQITRVPASQARGR